ncbi:MAG: hypothetical protein L0Y72_00875 [Gemmataceae bacterium]|nr:hypothetical protein [Gemmataceae bacterium]MCI0737564.1 hypothetical protein [Gemmataceae bacterium]
MRVLLRLLLAPMSFFFISPTLPGAQAQELPPTAIQQVQKLLDELLIETAVLEKAVPLAEYLTALEKQLPKEKRVELRIDKNAFGNRFAEVAATPVRMPSSSPKSMSLRHALELALRKIKVKADYRIGAWEIAITTPERALYTVVYDIRDLVEKPEIFSDSRWNAHDNLPLRNAHPVQTSARIVQFIQSAFDPPDGNFATPEIGRIEILNGAKMAIRSNASKHAVIDSAVSSLRRIADVAVILKSELYEVDQAFHASLLKSRRLSADDLEELERIFLGDKLPQTDELKKLLEDQKRQRELWTKLAQQKPVLTGDEKRIENGRLAPILSKHDVGRCLPGPAQIRKGDKTRQTFLEGISFVAGVQVSPDRRHVRLKLTEKAIELKVIHKIKVWVAAEEQVEAEVPILDESVNSRLEVIPDGGSVLIPVHWRPRAMQEKDRWWVLSLTPRIYIEEEERHIREPEKK